MNFENSSFDNPSENKKGQIEQKQEKLRQPGDLTAEEQEELGELVRKIRENRE